jgi:amidase
LYWEHSKAVSGGEYLMAVTIIQAFTRRFAQAFTEFDAWLSPTLAEPPPRLGELVASDADPTAAEQRGAAFVAFPLVVANLTGAPAMSVPLHWNDAGLPIGVHVVGRYGDEATMFRLAAQLENAHPWADRWPAVSMKELSR